MAQGDLNSFAADYASDIVSTFDIDKAFFLNLISGEFISFSIYC